MEDEIHPRHRRLQILLEPREQEGEDDTGDRDVERDAAAQRVEQPRALLGPDERRECEHRCRQDVALDREEAEEVAGAEGRPVGAGGELVGHRAHRRGGEPEPNEVRNEVFART